LFGIKQINKGYKTSMSVTYSPLTYKPQRISIKNEVVYVITKSFGNRVRILRNNLDVSREKFALKINMDRTYLASVENGKRILSLDNIKK
jgi:munI regulatory protein